jgi:glycosyltransferase involved in cell wall biosynthesis
LRVLLLHSELGVLRGGGENFSRRLFPAYAARGHSVHAAFAANRRGQYPLALPDGIEPIPIRGWWSSNLGQATFSAVKQRLTTNGPLRRYCDRVQEALSWRAFAWHTKRFRGRIVQEFADKWDEYDVVYVHGDTTLANAVARYRPTILRLPGPVTAELAPLLRGVHAVCANGDALVRVRSFLGEHAIELPIGLDTDAFRPGRSGIRDRLQWKERDFVIGYVGRLVHLKGVDLLAEGFRNVVQRRPDARLLLIGGGDQEAHIRKLLAGEFAQGRVHIESGVDHDYLADWYRTMDLFVMPSRYENYSNAIVEAMACGVPFLASNVGGNRQLSESAAGSLFETESIPSLTESLIRVIDDGDALDIQRQACTAAAARINSWTATAERLETIIVSRLGVKNVRHVAGQSPALDHLSPRSIVRASRP